MTASFDSHEQTPNRDELIARLQLMETMVAEGRRATGRYGWSFVLWGIVDIVGVLWGLAKPHLFAVWPVTIGIGIVLQIAGLKLFRARCSPTIRNRAIGSVWRMLGVVMCLFCFSAGFAHRAGGTVYVAAIFMILGMAHGTSAMILRWPAQGVVSALWLAGGLACYMVPAQAMLYLFLAEMVVGMVLFGLYAMLLEGKEPNGVLHG